MTSAFDAGQEGVHSPANISQVLHVVGEIGRLMLENGSETSHAEAVMERLGEHFGIRATDCFALPTGIVLTMTGPDGSTETITRRISKRGIELSKVSALARLADFPLPLRRRRRMASPLPQATGQPVSGPAADSRKARRKAAKQAEGKRPAPSILAELADLQDLEKRVEQIRSRPDYPSWFQVPVAGIVAGLFAVFFGGGLDEALFAGAAGVLIKLFLLWAGARGVNRFFTTIFGAMIAAGAAVAAEAPALIDRPDTMIAGSIMLLVPGLLMVNSIRDIIAGDLASGVTRLTEAMMYAVAIAVGTGLVLGVRLFLTGAAVPGLSP